MSSTFYDTHAHLDFPDFADDLPGLVERAAAAGIGKIVTIGTDFESSRKALEISSRFPNVKAAVGWHPGDASAAPEDVREELRELAVREGVAAIGEIGLDFYRMPSAKGGSPEDDERCVAKQKTLFRQQLEVAAELEMPCVIHTRDSFEATLGELEPYAGRVRCVFHCFVSNPDCMRRVIELGSLVSFTGIVTFKNAEEVRETLRATPPDRFMLETDAPFLAPAPYRGKRCEPAYVREISQAVAEIRGVPVEELSEVTCRTAEGFFRKL